MEDKKIVGYLEEITESSPKGLYVRGVPKYIASFDSITFDINDISLNYKVNSENKQSIEAKKLIEFNHIHKEIEVKISHIPGIGTLDISHINYNPTNKTTEYNNSV